MHTPLAEQPNKRKSHPAKECAYLSMFVALLIAVQLALSSLPGIELVTVLIAAFSFAMGAKRGMIAAAAFCLLRQLVFGFFPTVLVLYLAYYPAFAALFGLLGKKITSPAKGIVAIAATASLCTALFTVMDNIITPLWYGYSERALKIYFKASLSFMIPQIVSAAVTVGTLFLPLWAVFRKLRSSLAA
jgi:hypothetical protein